MSKRWLIVVSAGCVLASVALARQGIVTTRDGRTLEGDVTEKDELVTVNAKNIGTSIPKADVQQIEYSDSVDDQFKSKLAKLGPKDVAGRIDPARWAFNSRRYDLARDALDDAQKIDPNSREAADLQDTVRMQVDLEHHKKAADAAAPAPAAEATSKPVAATGPSGGHRVLTAAEINSIRQGEVTSYDTNLSIRFENDIRRKFTTLTNRSLADFNAEKPLDQFIDIRNHGNSRLLEDVKITRDPQAILEFRRIVQPMLLQNCATSGCHGGPNSGQFFLNNPADTDASAYSNFYMLQRFKSQVKHTGGTFGSNGQMIDRTQPTDSLILQYALPPDIADIDHPDVAGYRGFLRNGDDPRYKQLYNWLSHTLSPVDPHYSMDAPPEKPAATKPK